MPEPPEYREDRSPPQEIREAGVQVPVVETCPVEPRGLSGKPNILGDVLPEKTPMARELRPRVRLLCAGAEALSSAELLAVLFSAFPGTGDRRALELAESVISGRGGLDGLMRSTVYELLGEAGLGEARAAVLLAAAELGKRLVCEAPHWRPVISGPEDVYKILRGRLAHLDRERFVVVLLNTKNAVIESPTVSIGTLSASLVHPREVFKPAIRAGAAAVILAHNHPSREDREVTRRVAEAGKTIGIEVLDHLIIGDGFYSFKECGLL